VVRNWLLLLLMLAPIYSGCGGIAIIDGEANTSSQGGAKASTSSGVTTGVGGAGILPKCDEGVIGCPCDRDLDCAAPGAKCVEVIAGGPRVCSHDWKEATRCKDSRSDECCTSDDCSSGECYLADFYPYCGGLQTESRNQCLGDQCESDADCGCPTTPGRFNVCHRGDTVSGPIAQCKEASCRVDADCEEEPGGKCMFLLPSCCYGSVLGTLYCVYPSACMHDSDCPNGYCEIKGAKTQCVDGILNCPD